MGENEFFSRKNLPRLFELADGNAAFGEFLSGPDFQDTIPYKRKFVGDFEADLSGLDDEAWAIFKEKAAPYLSGGYTQKVKKGNLEGIKLPRGWQQLQDTRNEARAYNYLRSNGYSKVKFIQEVTTETPDLEAMRGSRPVLCEVKTINRSDFTIFQLYDCSFATCLNKRQDKFINARTCGNEPCTRSGVIDHKPALADNFFMKLEEKLLKAKRQLDADQTGDEPVKVVYFFLNFDDALGEYIGNYEPQLDQFRDQPQNRGIDIVFDYFPPGYWASA